MDQDFQFAAVWLVPMVAGSFFLGVGVSGGYAFQPIDRSPAVSAYFVQMCEMVADLSSV